MDSVYSGRSAVPARQETRRVKRSTIVFAATLAAVVAFAAPAAGSRRSTSSHDWAFAVALQNDGKIVAAGLTYCCGRRGLALARYLPDGRFDPSFGRGGKVVLTGHGYGAAVAVQKDGRIVAGGGIGHGLVRLTRSGVLDPTFGRGGTVRTSSNVLAVATQPDGKVIAGGSVLARYTAAGKPDVTFGRNGRRSVGAEGIALQRDGKIVVAGGDLVRFDANGRPDSTFASRGPDVGVSSVALDRYGNIAAAGSLGSGLSIARLTADGRLDAAFGGDGVVEKHGCASVFDEGVA